MEGLSPKNTQRLIDLMNRLENGGHADYDFAKIEKDKIEEARLLRSASLKLEIAREIDFIINPYKHL